LPRADLEIGHIGDLVERLLGLARAGRTG
jgi:hypothetical protein